MNYGPLISVIIPVYGTEDYIECCARSVLSQTYRRMEVIVVDDGTPDAAIERFQAVLDGEFPSLKDCVKIIHKENGGLPQARLSGLKEAKGDYIVHLDSDDSLVPDALEQLARCAAHTHADLIYYDFWKEYGKRRKRDRERNYTVQNKKKYMRRLYRDAAYGYLWNKMARRSLYEGLFFPVHAMHEDIVVVTQLLWKANSIVRLPLPLVHYRRDNPSAATRMGKAKRRGQMARNYLDLYEHEISRGKMGSMSVVRDDILLRAAWVGISLDPGLFKERPYLRKEALHLPLMPFHRVLLVQQLIMKRKLRKMKVAKKTRSIGNNGSDLRLLVHLHIYYKDQVPWFIGKLKSINGCKWDLLCTWNNPDPETEAKIRAFRPDARFLEVENVGYDIWPFIKALRAVNPDDYDLVLKLHTKGPSDETNRINGLDMKGYRWRNLLVDALLESPRQFRSALNIIRRDTKVGMVCNGLLIRHLSLGLVEDTSALKKELHRIGLHNEGDIFCAGTMFMARMYPYSFVRDGDLTAESFGGQSVSHSTGSLAHVYERILSMVITAEGFSIAPIIMDKAAYRRHQIARAFSPVFKWVFSLERVAPRRDKILTIFGLKFNLSKHGK